MTIRHEEAEFAFPNHLVPIACWISYKTDIDARTRLLEIADSAQKSHCRRNALVALAKMDWAEMHMGKKDYQICVYVTPLAEMYEADELWLANRYAQGCKPTDSLYQVCIAFNDAFDLMQFKEGVREIY